MADFLSSTFLNWVTTALHEVQKLPLYSGKSGGNLPPKFEDENPELFVTLVYTHFIRASFVKQLPW